MRKVQPRQVRQPPQLDHIGVIDPASPKIYGNDTARGIALNLAAKPGDPIGIDGQQLRREENQQHSAHHHFTRAARRLGDEDWSS
jgi:hypothetical protein